MQNFKISDEKNVIFKINKQNKEERFLKTQGVEVINIWTTKRTREKSPILQKNTFKLVNIYIYIVLYV